MAITLDGNSLTWEEMFEAWDRGECTFPDEVANILALNGGERVGTAISPWSRCPVHNATCRERMILKVYAIHPDKPGIMREIDLCPFGCDTIDVCPLSK